MEPVCDRPHPDVAEWTTIAAGGRELLLFVLSSLMVAQERTTTKFSGLVARMAARRRRPFRATQQVDEARHIQFYAAFRTK